METSDLAGRRWSVEDCKGEEVLVGDLVMDSYGDEARVEGFRLYGGLPWIVAGGREMVPGLVRRCGR